MSWLRWVEVWVVGLVWLTVGAGCSLAAGNDEKPDEAEAVVIPLDQIWGYNMPNSKNIEKHLAPKSYGRTLEAIYRSLRADRQGKAAQPGFAVTGNLDSVIEQMHQVLVEKEKPKHRCQADDQVSLVFFAYESGWYVQLTEVQRKGTKITIQYQFVPHESEDSAVHLAMIPFGKLPSGKYNVRIEQVPMEKRFTEVGFTSPDAKASKQLISQQFSFVVTQ